jgi:DNA-binding MarR family transcriptional regulator
LQLQQLVSKAAERAWIAFLRVGPPLTERIEAALKAAGLPGLAWYDVLWELEQAEAAMRQRDLGDRLLVARYNLSRLLDRLERDGLIEREDCADDARGHMLKLTRAGRALRARMWPPYAAAIRANVEDKLSSSEAETMTRLFEKLR